MSDALHRAIIWIGGVIGGTAVLALMFLTLGDALMRGLGRPILGANEITEALLLVVVAAAIPVSIVSGKAIAIEGPVALMPRRLGFIIVLAGTVLSAGLMAYLGFHSYRTAADARDFGERSALLHIPYDVLYMVLAVGMGFAAVAFLLHWVIDRRTGGAAGSHDAGMEP